MTNFTDSSKIAMDQYQDAARETAKYPGAGSILGLAYCTLGLAGESGEVAEKVKKIIRDHDGVSTPSQKLEIAKEISDVLWYVAGVASELGYTLGEIAHMNITKLRSRMDRGVLGGSGDNR